MEVARAGACWAIPTEAPAEIAVVPVLHGRRRGFRQLSSSPRLGSPLPAGSATALQGSFLAVAAVATLGQWLPGDSGPAAWRRPLRPRASRRGVARAAKGRRPRWAPGGVSGGTTAVVEETSITKREKMGLDLNRQEYAVEQVTEEVFPGDGRCYRVIFENGIGLRTGPSIGAERSGSDLMYGEVFEIRRELRKGNRRYYELLDGRGWAFDWIEIQGERWELVELAAQLYSVAFPEGVYGVQWGSDTTLRFTTVMDFTESCRQDLTQAGVCAGDVLVMIDDDPVVGLPLGKCLERIWASCGYQPGDGTFYRVTTEGPYGIGIRTEPDIDAPRTGEDLLRGEIFEVDEIAPSDGEGPTYLHLADDRGWVFDTSPIDPEHPSCENIKDKPPGAVATMWRGDPQTLMKALGLKFRQDGFGQPFKITVLEEGQPPQIIRAEPGSNLRQNLVENGFNVYANFRGAFHCNARALCGTCVLHVTEGNENLTVYSVNEKRAMAANPEGFRLCCNVDVYGDCTVRLRPEKIIYGGGTM